MDSYINNGIQIQLINTQELPFVRQCILFKDRTNILSIPDSIVVWLRSDPQSKDYTDEYSIFTYSDRSNIILKISIIRESLTKGKGAVVINLTYNEQCVVDTATAFNFENIPDTNSANLLSRKIGCVIDIILGYNSTDLFRNTDGWFKINID